MFFSKRTISDVGMKHHHARFSNPVLDLTMISEFLFDCDGVLWHGNEAISNSIKALHFLKEKSIKTKFITNNCYKTREELKSKLTDLGFAVDIDDIITSGSITAHYLSQKKLNCIYMVGNPALRDEIERLGIKVLDDVPTVQNVPRVDDLIHTTFSTDVQAVVVGWDPNFSYRSMCIASLYLQRPGVEFVVTNGDAADGTKGRLIPGTGALAQAIEAASGNHSPIVCGKPSDILIEYLSGTRDHNTATGPPRLKLFVGDRLDTDIVFANKAGFVSCLVLSGVTTEEGVMAALNGKDSLLKPTYVMPDVWNLVNQGYMKES